MIDFSIFSQFAMVIIFLLGLTAAEAQPAQPEISPVPLASDVANVIDGGRLTSAVGKLNNGGLGSCTAVLISRRYVLTAAHCLFDRKLSRFLPTQSLHLVFGLDGTQYKDHLLVSAYFVPPLYDPLKPYETIQSDWALLRLADEPKAGSQPLEIEKSNKLSVDLNLLTVGYSKVVPYRMTANQKCHFVGRSSDSRVLFDSCRVPDGYSGGPLIIEKAGTHSFSVAGINVGNVAWRGQSFAVAVSSEAIWRDIKPCIVDQKCEFQHIATGRDPTAAEVLAGASIDTYQTSDATNSRADCDELYEKCDYRHGFH